MSLCVSAAAEDDDDITHTRSTLKVIHVDYYIHIFAISCMLLLDAPSVCDAKGRACSTLRFAEVGRGETNNVSFRFSFIFGLLQMFVRYVPIQIYL